MHFLNKKTPVPEVLNLEQTWCLSFEITTLTLYTKEASYIDSPWISIVSPPKPIVLPWQITCPSTLVSLSYLSTKPSRQGCNCICPNHFSHAGSDWSGFVTVLTWPLKWRRQSHCDVRRSDPDQVGLPQHSSVLCVRWRRERALRRPDFFRQDAYTAGTGRMQKKKG
jgi:hypothetical protein